MDTEEFDICPCIREERVMTSHTRRPGRRRRIAAVTLVAAIGAVLLAVAPAAAVAHGDDEPTTALALVRQAIALIVNTPDDTDMVADKINDAMESDDTSGVQIALVEKAKAELAAGDLHQTRALLEQAIGARVHTGAADPVVIGQVPPPATGAETGTLAAIDALPGRGGLHGGEWTLLALSALIAVAGVGLSFRLHPHPVHVREEQASDEEAVR